jgi:hypothetical protein
MNPCETTGLQSLFDECWSSDAFLTKFLRDPITILLDRKLMDMRGMDVEIVEYKANKIHLIFHSGSPDKVHLQSQRHPRMTDIDT